MLPENTLSPPRLLRLREVKERTGMGTSTIYLKMSRGEFPAPIKIGNQSRAGAVAWVEAEVNAFITKLISERDAGNGWQSLGSAAAQVVKKVTP